MLPFLGAYNPTCLHSLTNFSHGSDREGPEFQADESSSMIKSDDNVGRDLSRQISLAQAILVLGPGASVTSKKRFDATVKSEAVLARILCAAPQRAPSNGDCSSAGKGTQWRLRER